MKSGTLHEAPEALGRGLQQVQKELTRLREVSRFRQLDVAIRSLPADDMRRIAWLSIDKFSTTWVSV